MQLRLVFLPDCAIVCRLRLRGYIGIYVRMKSIRISHWLPRFWGVEFLMVFLCVRVCLHEVMLRLSESRILPLNVCLCDRQFLIFVSISFPAPVHGVC